LEQSNLRTHPITSQLGQLNGVTLPFNESFKHVPGTFPDDISDDRTQLDSGGFQDLVDAVTMPIPLLHQLGMGTHQVTQFPNRLGGNKAGGKSNRGARDQQSTRYPYYLFCVQEWRAYAGH